MRQLCRSVMAAVLALGISHGVASAQNYSYGMVTHYLDATLGDKMTELGAGFVRLDFNWFQIEPSKGNFDWGGVDSFVNHAQARGLKVFATLAYSPGWANGGQPERVPPTNIQDWYDFVYAVAVHFNGRVDHWGMWNEPNDSNFFAGSRAQYETIASTGRSAVKAVNANMRVLGPDVAIGGILDGWFAAVMNSTGHSTFDIVTVHYYVNPNDNRTKWVDQFMDTYVAPSRYGKDVWMTETGRGICDSQNSHYQGVLERWMPRRAWWTKTFFYHLYDGRPGCDSEGIIFTSGGAYQLAFITYRDWIATHP